MRTVAQIFAITAVTAIFQSNAQAQTPLEAIQSQDDLEKTVAALDTALFDAVNHCDLKKVESYFAEDAVFLHDKVAPLIGRAVIVDSIKNNLCGKVVRELVPGTMEVSLLKDYGAVEIGVHRFLHPFTQDHGVVGEAKFIHIWQVKDGSWRITQVISHDHHQAK